MRVDKYNQIGILIDGSQNDVAPFLPSGTVNWGVITASQIIGRTECVNYAGTGNCASVGLLTTGPLFGQDGLRVTSGSYATVDSSLISQNLVNGFGAPTRNSETNNANLTLAAGVRYVGAKIAQYASATGQVVYSRIGTSNIVDNAYGVMNVAADGTTAVTGNPNSGELASQGNLLKAEGNWWGLRFNSLTNPGPAISPTTNPQTPENPVNGTATLETVSGGTTSNAVDFFPYRSGPQSDPTNGQLPVLTAPIPVDDAAPSVSLSGPASANRGTAITLAAMASDDFGVKRVRFAEGFTTLGTATLPPYSVSVTIPADAACNTVRTYSAVATDSAGQTKSATFPVTVTCSTTPTPTTPAATGTATATATASAGRDPHGDDRRRRLGHARSRQGRQRRPGRRSVRGVRLLAALDRGQVEGPVLRELAGRHQVRRRRARHAHAVRRVRGAVRVLLLPEGLRRRRPGPAPDRHRQRRLHDRGLAQRRRLALRREAERQRRQAVRQERHQAHDHRQGDLPVGCAPRARAARARSC